MTITLTSFVQQLQNMVPDIPSNELATTNLQQQIKEAVRNYSLLKPDETTVDIAGNGTGYYEVLLLSGWEDELSHVESVQFPAPIIANNETPQTLDKNEWIDDYYDGAKRYIYFRNYSPSSSDSFRIRYTSLYTWSAGTITTNVKQISHGFSVNDYVYLESALDCPVWQSTTGAELLATHQVKTVTDADTVILTELASNLPNVRFYIVCVRAACLLCNEIAARYSRTSDSTISLDSVDHPSRTDNFLALAERYCQEWQDAMGISSGADGDGIQFPIATEMVELDTRPSWRQSRRYLMH